MRLGEVGCLLGEGWGWLDEKSGGRGCPTELKLMVHVQALCPCSTRLATSLQEVRRIYVACGEFRPRRGEAGKQQLESRT